ncbi:MAG: hypothetical protein F4Y94_04140 [Chloroflexi bacterium]|nr:hypothetical protein [Chloroflexota bacterium]
MSAAPAARCWCCGLRRCTTCCHSAHDCRWLFGDECCQCRATTVTLEAATAPLTHNGDDYMARTRLGYSAEQIAHIPPPWDAHVPAFVIDDDGPGCACCGAGSCWCECRCGRTSPRFNCAQDARRWHINHVRLYVDGQTSASA